jgi:DNA polymerase-1
VSDAPRLFLIDGYALIYRAFFAMIARPLRTAAGENTSAVWGVANFLLRLREKYRPAYVAWVNDAGDSFRTEKYAEYKSTRQKLDDDLQADFDRSCERIEALLHAMGVKLVAVDGYEADDVIGTLAARASAAGLDAVIVSGDKDFHQLVGPHVTLLNPGRGGPGAVEESWVTEANGSERLGVPPSQVRDYLALVGDSSDNVPGVKGIGEKGAQKLLAEYGDLETILANAGRIEQKRTREALLASMDVARLSQELVTIHTDVPVPVALADLVPGAPDRAALVKLLTELEFYSLARKFGTAEEAPEAPSSASPTAPSVPVAAAASVTVVSDPGALPAIVARLRAAPLVALDTETTSLQPRDAELIGLGLAASPTEAWYLSFGHRPPDGDLAAPAPVPNLPPLDDPACASLVALLTDPAVRKAGHHIKYDWQVLRRAGVELRGVAFDSMLAAFVLQSGRRSFALDTLSLDELGRGMRSYTDLVKRGRTAIPFAEVPVPEAAAYCGADCTTVLELHDVYAPQLVATPSIDRLLREVELPLTPVLVDLEWTGIRVDVDLLRRLGSELARDLDTLSGQIAKVAGENLNLNSPKQLAAVLFEKHQLPVLRRTKTGPSTDAAVLEELAGMGHELPQLILDYRELQKLKSTYADTLPLEVNAGTGRIHTSFVQTGAATGRLSSTDPNLQNIPVRTPRGAAIRRAFIPAEGWTLLVADYSQIELRLMAHLSGDPAFVEAFKAGGDIHRQTAALVFNVPLAEVTPEQRARAKTINFGIIYGQGPFALGRSLGITQDEAKEFIAQYFTRFAGVRAYLNDTVEFARREGYVETILGRRRYIPELKDRNFNTRAYGERNAQNSPLQGSAADLIKLAMIRIHALLGERGLASRMLLQVHDELVFEVPPAELPAMRTLVKEQMETVHPLRVPLVADVGEGANWLDAKH